MPQCSLSRLAPSISRASLAAVVALGLFISHRESGAQPVACNNCYDGCVIEEGWLEVGEPGGLGHPVGDKWCFGDLCYNDIQPEPCYTCITCQESTSGWWACEVDLSISNPCYETLAAESCAAERSRDARRSRARDVNSKAAPSVVISEG